MAQEEQAAAPQQAGRRETLLDGIPDFSRSRSSSDRQPAPRIVPQPDNRTVWKPPLPFSLLVTPVNLLYRLVSSSLGILSYIFPFLPRIINAITNRGQSRAARRNTTGRRPLNPRDTAARFIREFGEEYGDHRLRFYENGYAQAYDTAKKDLKFLLVVLLSPEHDDNNTFVREILLSQEFDVFVNNPENNLILWAGNVQDSEAYQVSMSLNCTKYPFAALVVHTPQDSATAMSTVARVTGIQSPSAFIAKLRNAVTQNAPGLTQVRNQRREQEATRNLRQEQESAYERSLAQDRERMRLRREAEAAREREEQEARAKATAIEKAERDREHWRIWTARTIPREPGVDVKDATRLSIRMPSGDRVVRRFPPDVTIEDLYNYVECHDILTKGISLETHARAGYYLEYKHEYKFNLVSPMPRTVYDLASGGTVAERIGRSGNLIVESIVDDDEDEG